MTILALILILSFLVIIHEVGHLLAAFFTGIKVEEFGVGYPPKAKTLFTWRGVPFTLNWIPFGGFVRMAGEEESAEGTVTQQKGQFYSATIPKRLLVILAGATVNFLFGIIAFSVVYSIAGIPQKLEEARINYIAPGSPAAQAGIPVDVNIVSFEQDGVVTSVKTTEDVISYVQNNRGKTVTLTTTGTCDQLSCQESLQSFSTYLRTESETPEGEGSLGLSFKEYVLRFYPWWEMPFRGAAFGLSEALMLGQLILQALQSLGVNLFTKGVVPSELAGPVGIVHQAQSAGLLNQGWLVIIAFAGQLSINLAIMNVLPIAPLDGGKAVFTILETFFSRKRLHQLEYWSNYTGYIFLMGLIVLVTVRDISRIIWQ